MNRFFLFLFILLSFTLFGCMTVSETPPNAPGYICYHDGSCTLLGDINLNNKSLYDAYYLHVLNNVLIGAEVGEYAYYNNVGDLYLGNGSQGIYNGQLGIWSLPYGAGLIVNEYGSSLNITKFNGTAILNASTQIICDETNPFNSFNDGMFFEIISSIPSYEGATGEIKDYINSSCIRISFGSAGSDIIVDAVNMSYIVYPHPVFSVFDNGYISAEIGENPDAKFEIHIPNGTGSESVLIEDTAGANQHHGFNLDYKMGNYEGQVAQHIFMYSDEQLVDKSIIMLEMVGDSTNMNNSVGTFIEMNVVGTPAYVGEGYIDGMRISPKVNNLMHVGSTDILDRAYYDDTTTITDVTSSFLTASNNTVLFEEDNSILYIGNQLNFTNIVISLLTTANSDIEENIYYCNSSEEWEELIYYTDGTAGFTSSGVFSFINPNNRGVCNKDINGVAFDDVTKHTYIAIQRTRNNLVTYPTENTIGIGGSSDYMYFKKDTLKLQPTNSEPVDCTLSENLGAIYFDISEDDLCVCKSTGWEVVTDGSSCS